MYASRYSMPCTHGPFGDRTVANAFAGPPRPAWNPDDCAPQVRRSRHCPSIPYPSGPACSSPPLSCWRFNDRVPALYVPIHPEKSLIFYSRLQGTTASRLSSRQPTAPCTADDRVGYASGARTPSHERSAARVGLRMGARPPEDCRAEGEPPARASVEMLAANRHHAAKARCQPNGLLPTVERKTH